MKHHYASTLGIALFLVAAMPAVGEAAVPSHCRQVGMKRAPKRESPAPLMLPSSEKVYFMEDGWVLVGEMKYEYDTRGNMTRMVMDEMGEVTSVLCGYDDHNQIVSRYEMYGEGDAEVYRSKRTYEYDPIVHTFCIKRMGYDWDGADWTPNYFCEINEVTRDGAGNVTRVLKSLPYSIGEMVPAYLSEWGYGKAGDEAESYAYFLNMGGKDVNWILNNDIEYREITWDRTDGQLLGDLIDMVVENPAGPNRFRSARAYFEGEPDGYVFADYPAGDEPGFRITYTANDPDDIGMVQEFVMLDADTYAYQYTVMHYIDEETEELTKEPTYVIEQIFMADHKGNPVSDEIYETNGDSERELAAGINYRNTYDDAGNLMEVIQSEYDYDTGAYLETMRTVYAEYVDVSAGVSDVSSGEELRIVELRATGNGLITVYSADGTYVISAKDSLDLSPLVKGLYLVRCGKKAVKVIR